MIGPFNSVDLFIIIIVSLSLIFGLLKGFLREIFSFIFFILAIILASLFYSDISNFFVKGDIAPSEQVLKINPSTYQRIENGSGNYTIMNLLKIVSFYPDLKLSGLIKRSGI